MRDDDEIIESYEEELAPVRVPLRRPNRGFWLVAIAMLLGCVLLLVEIFANRPLVGSIGRAQSDLRAARSIALQVSSRSGAFDDADAAGLAAADPTRHYKGPDDASTRAGEISVFASGTSWAAAVEVRPGACFYVFEQIGKDTRYGGGTLCTGRAALTADQDAW